MISPDMVGGGTKNQPEKTGETRESVEVLKTLRYGWRDEIPDEVKHSYDPTGGDVKWKVRVAWFSAILGEFAFLKRCGVVWPDEVRQEIEAFKEIQHQRSQKSFQERMTKSEEIEQGNKVLDIMIDFLESNK